MVIKSSKEARHKRKGLSNEGVSNATTENVPHRTLESFDGDERPFPECEKPPETTRKRPSTVDVTNEDEKEKEKEKERRPSREHRTKGTETKANEKDQQKSFLPVGYRAHKNQYEILDVIGAGGYGQIYKARNLNSGELSKKEVAVKVMLKEREPQRMVLEQRVLRDLKGREGFPKIYGSGMVTIGNRNLQYLIMELLGPNLSELRRMRPSRRFEPVTAARAGLQCINLLHYLHDLGYVHRDIKPANLCCGRSGTRVRQVYVVDFGLARRSKDSKGRPIERKYAGFRGTLRYVSINVHARKDQCAVDDLISLYYSIAELTEGSLPWSKMKDQDLIFRTKKNQYSVSKRMPESFVTFYTTLIETENPHQPDYASLLKILKSVIPKNYDEKTPMEWEENCAARRRKGSTDRNSDKRRKEVSVMLPPQATNSKMGKAPSPPAQKKGPEKASNDSQCLY